MRERYAQLAQHARLLLEHGGRDTDVPEVEPEHKNGEPATAQREGRAAGLAKGGGKR